MPITRPTLTYGPVQVLDTPTREVFAPDASIVSNVFKVKHNERWNAVVWFLGYARLAYSGGPGTTVVRLERLTPKPHYDSATDTALTGSYAVAVPSVTPYKPTGKSAGLASLGEGKWAKFDKAVMDVQYEHVPFAVLEDSAVTAAQEWRRYVWLKMSKTTPETLTLPAGSRKYVKDTGGSGTVIGSIPYGKVVFVPVTRIVLSWELLPQDLYNPATTTPTAWQKRVWGWPADGIKPLLGRVNSHDWLAYKAGTLLLESVDPIQRKHPTVGLSWTFEVTYLHNPIAGWLNAYYHASPGATHSSGWYFAASDASGTPAQYYAPASVPDDYGLYNVGRIEKVFDVTG